MPSVAYDNGCKGNAIVTLVRKLCRRLRQDGCRRSRAGGVRWVPKETEERVVRAARIPPNLESNNHVTLKTLRVVQFSANGNHYEY